MFNYTREGKTREPVWPTSATVYYNVGAVTSGTLADWKDVDGTAGDLALDPLAIGLVAPSDEILNNSPVKITANTGSKTVTLLPGVYHCSVDVEGYMSGSVGQQRLAVTDDTPVGAPVTFMELDQDGNNGPLNGKKSDLSRSGLIKISEPTNIRLVVTQAAGGATLNTTLVGMHLRRLGDYIAQ